MIYGVTGSGKTTLAKRVSRITGIPWHSVDDLTWEADWTTVPLELQRSKIANICQGDSWILDTAYGNWIDIPLPRVQLIVALDYPRIVSFSRLLKRTVARAIDGRPVCNGNRQTVKGIFTKESILLWHYKSFDRKRSRILTWRKSPEGRDIVHIASPKQLELWLVELEKVYRPS